jgi:hypothetical protein
MVLGAVDVFAKSPPRALLHPDLDLYMQPLLVARRPSKLVISACLFFYPSMNNGRGDEYMAKFMLYMRGLEKLVKTAAIVYPDWNVRVYVDHSLSVMAKDLPDVFAAVDQQLKALHKSVDVFEAVAVRMPRLPVAATFMPSMWRLLAAFDPTIDATIITDLDQVVHPIYMFYVRRWLDSEDDRRLFVLHMSRYKPPWCLTSMIFDKRSGEEGVVCPCAQFVAARCPLPVKAWRACLDTVFSPKLIGWATAFLQDKLLQRIQSSKEYREWALSYLRDDKFDADKAFASTLRASLEKIAHSSRSSVKARTSIGSILSSEYLFAWTQLYAQPTRWSGPLLKFLSPSNKDFRSILEKLLGQQGYGVDEHAISVLMISLEDQTRLLRVPQAQSRTGVNFPSNFILITNRTGLPRVIKLAQILVEAEGYPQQINQAVEYMARCLLIAASVQASSGSAPSLHKKVACVSRQLQRHAWLMFAKVWPDVKFEEFTERVKADAHLSWWAEARKVLVLVPGKLKMRDVFLAKDGRFSVGTEEALRSVWEVLRDGLLAEVLTLHSFVWVDAVPEAFSMDFALPSNCAPSSSKKSHSKPGSKAASRVQGPSPVVFRITQ